MLACASWDEPCRVEIIDDVDLKWMCFLPSGLSTIHAATCRAKCSNRRRPVELPYEASHVALGDEYTADHSWFSGFSGHLRTARIAAIILVGDFGAKVQSWHVFSSLMLHV